MVGHEYQPITRVLKPEYFGLYNLEYDIGRLLIILAVL
jgi:hypothetical protein